MCLNHNCCWLFSFFFFLKTVVHQCSSSFSTTPHGSQPNAFTTVGEKIGQKVYWVGILFPSPTPYLILVVSTKDFFALLPTELFMYCFIAKVFKLMFKHQIIMVSPKVHFSYTQNIILYIFWCKSFWEFWLCESHTFSRHFLKIECLVEMKVFTRTKCKCKGQHVASEKEDW